MVEGMCEYFVFELFRGGFIDMVLEGVLVSSRIWVERVKWEGR